MQKIFDKELDQNNKVGKSCPLDDSENTSIGDEIAQRSGQNTGSKIPLSAQKKACCSNNTSEPMAGSNGRNGTTAIALGSTRAPTRLPRATRTSASLHNAEERSNRREVEKYSVDVGLGERWQK